MDKEQQKGGKKHSVCSRTVKASDRLHSEGKLNTWKYLSVRLTSFEILSTCLAFTNSF